MRKIVLAFAAVGVLGLALPAVSPANAKEIIIKTGDRARHHERFFERHHRPAKVVIIKRGHRHDY